MFPRTCRPKSRRRIAKHTLMYAALAMACADILPARIHAQPPGLQPAVEAAPGPLAASGTTWNDVDLDQLLNRPLNASQSMTKLHIDRTFIEDGGIAETTRLQFGDGAPYLWDSKGYSWHSAAFCYSPLYFEQPNLERYGQGPGKTLAPTVSAARFVGQLTTLPLAVFCTPPWTKSCTLGHQRPGDLAPWQRKTSQH